MKMQCLLYGSPTAELFAASYNNTGKSNTITLGLGTNGYNYSPGKNWLKPEDNHGIYNKGSSSYWCLASPSNNDGLTELIVNGFYCCFNNGDIKYNSFTVRPVVCIPTSVFNSKYGTATNLVDE